jgi:hypothetical protein
VILTAWAEVWACPPPIAATHIYWVAVTHRPPLRYQDLTPADTEMKLCRISTEEGILLLAGCTVNGDTRTSIEWSVEPSVLHVHATLVADFLARVRARGVAQRLGSRPVGFGANW